MERPSISPHAVNLFKKKKLKMEKLTSDVDGDLVETVHSGKLIEDVSPVSPLPAAVVPSPVVGQRRRG